MSDKELLAQIAQVAGAINKHMNSTQLQNQGYHGYNPSPPPMRGGYGGYSGYSMRGRGRGSPVPYAASGPFNRSLTLNKTPISANPIATTTPSTVPAVATATRPLPVPAPVQGMAPRPIANPFVPTPAPSRHLTLVNKNTVNASTPAPLPSPASTPPPPKANTLAPSSGQQWIQSKGKNMSLMNPTTFKKTMDAKEKSIRTAKEKKLKLMQVRAKRAQDLRRGIVTMGGKEYSKSADGRKLIMRDTSQDNIVINGVKFRMDPRGNKLVRNAASTAGTAATTASKIATPTLDISPKAPTGATPKQFSVGGVVYVRTRSGNLVRANLVQKQLLEKREAQLKVKERRMATKKARPFCKYYTRFGTCQREFGCPFVHSRSHLAICKKFLRGVCPNTEATCKLSHTPSPHTVPACVHFQRAACNKDDCVYPHVRTNPQAPICRPFATEGWCEAGINCKDRHVWVCPDFATPAGCKKKCGLPHLPNGGTRAKKTSSDGNDTPASGSGNGNKWRRQDQQAAGSRYMDSQDAASLEEGVGAGRSKTRQYDENFIPLDLGDDFENQQAMLDEEDVVMSDQEMEEDEEDEEDVSSDGMEDVDEDDTEDVDEEDEVEEVSQDDSEGVDYGDNQEEEMNEEDEYNMYQDQLRYEDDDY
ncbi:hypothetical protein BGX29_008727 [Mortierella sp. GBA35]|nr:hypothetical protein BGX29_008727 [Mortierella sp. GBA35]